MPRKRDIRGRGQGGQRQGDGLGGGPVGPGSYSGRNESTSQTSENKGNPERSITGSTVTDAAIAAGILGLLFKSKKQMTPAQKLVRIILYGVMIILILYGIRRCSSGNIATEEVASLYSYPPVEELVEEPTQTQTSMNYGSPYGIQTINAGTTSTLTSSTDTNSDELDTTQSEGVRAKYFQANDNTTVNLMIYMIGTDLESQYGMGTNDLQEIVAGADSIPDNVNILIYGGGCKRWNNNLFSNSTNLIYQLKSGGQFEKLQDCGNEDMTDPETLGDFLRFVRKNYPTETPTNRNILILWDHGGGSIAGYGYDERYKSSGSMDLGELEKALTAGGIKFDFIGFDACLMATAETAYTLTPWADYMVGSEEAEPGIGWYYTRWLKTLCSKPAAQTLTLAKSIIDDFVDVCAQKCPGQAATLSVIDLAEFQGTVPKKLVDFSKATLKMINSDYSEVAKARSSAREFSADMKIDQVDIISLAKILDTDESIAFADALQSTIKYNRTSKTMTNAYGLSIYFPYRNATYVREAVETYSDIGINETYSDCIKAYASFAGAGQYSSVSTSSPLDMLFGNGYSSGQQASAEDVYALLNGLLGSYYGYGRSIPVNSKDATRYVLDNSINTDLLVWTKNDDGIYTMHLPKTQWELITAVEQNLFMYDGTGYIDYGCDVTQDCFTSTGDLVGQFSGAWLSINSWECAYYRENEVTDQQGNVTVTGRVPCLYNGQRAYLEVQHFNDKGSITGVRLNYQKDGINVTSKVIPVEDLKSSDTIVLIADFYNNKQEYEDTYKISNEMEWGNGLEVYDVELNDPANANVKYRITDIYGNQYWTPNLK